MYMPEPPLDRMLTAFEKDHDDGTGWARNLRDAINASPVLRENLERAVDGKHLTGFALSDENAVENNAYSSKTGMILLNQDTIRRAAPGSLAVGELVFALGHETDHALRRPEILAAAEKFDDEVRKVAESKRVPSHDYTQPLQDMLDARRADEAKAHLGGFNAYVSWCTDSMSLSAWQDIYAACPQRMSDFIARRRAGDSVYCELKAGLDSPFSLELPQSETNIEAMKRLYYDKPGREAGLGRSGTLDYRHHDASGLLDVIDKKDKVVNFGRDEKTRVVYRKPGTPEIVIDLNALRLDGSKLDTELFRRPASRPAPDIATETGAQERKRKREPEESKADGARPSDPVDTKRARTAPGQSLATPDLSAGTPPDSNHPIYRVALEAEYMLGPSAVQLGLDATALRNVAAGIACELQRNGSTTHTIAEMFPDADHRILFATDRPSNDDSRVVVLIDILHWSGKTASDELAKIAHADTDTPAPTQPHPQPHGRMH